MLFVVVLEFFVCWTPLHVLNTVYLFNPDAVYSTVGATGVSLVQLLAYAASCTNPITYCFMNRRFRAAFRRVFDCCSSRRAGEGGGPGGATSGNTGFGAVVRRRRRRRRRGRQRRELWRWHSGGMLARNAEFSTALGTELGVASEDASAAESAIEHGMCRHSGCNKSGELNVSCM
ncbi:hypothetical protein J437_LFUL010103 [Ladona fulva]|uniref:G-protein coupled receptors family 1 profile domain-containing protein n=1 Tax=Ladona fulva TaxID=123851 RepID=A0A8K0KCC2_LADFU|nr:hypothetical protein J437_LFUL010103 [Ladona fulva]